MKDEQFLRFAMVRYLMDSEDTRDSVFEEYANEIERGGRRRKGRRYGRSVEDII